MPFGSWGMAELSAGIVVGCFPVMPRFFQHVGPKACRIFTFGRRSANSFGYDQIARTALPRTNTFVKITNSLNEYGTRASVPDVDINSDAQIRGEQYKLDELPHIQPRMPPAVAVPTKRDDLEHGLPGPEVLGTRLNVKRQTI